MLRKVQDFAPPWGVGGTYQPQPCRSPDHEFPTMIVLSPGVWEHECPSCGHKIVVTVPLVTCQTASVGTSL